MSEQSGEHDPPFVVHDGRLVTENTWWWFENRNKAAMKRGDSPVLLCKHKVSLYKPCSICLLKCCQITIPGIGTCGLLVTEHKLDYNRREIHVRGPIRWNGGPVIEVDDAALRQSAKP